MTADDQPAHDRYARQSRLDCIGPDGTRRLGESNVVLIGCGALGTVIADTLVRAGVGRMLICDRDFIELNNLQRQVLFDETDIAAGLPKAEAAVRKLRRINSTVKVEAAVLDVNYTNIKRLADGADILLDGTDNFETRFLINDLAVKTGRPWIYGAVVGTTGLCMPIVPHDTPCLRCVFESAPPPEMNPTCDTAGVLATAVNLVASLQATEAIKLLTGRHDQLNRRLMNLDAWTGRFVGLNVQSTLETSDCPCCKHARFDYLSGTVASTTTTMCGRDAVQVAPSQEREIDLNAIAAKLDAVTDSPVRHNEFMLKAELPGHELTLFPDGRAIIKGTDEPEKAKSILARYLGA